MDTELFPVEDAPEHAGTALSHHPSSEQAHPAVTVVCEGLSKSFRSGGEVIRAVDDVSFAFTEGQFVAILGASGSGKSTLLYLLGGLDKPTSGELSIDGVDVKRLAGSQEHRFRRQKLGFVFQAFHLLPRLTALENVLLPMELKGGMTDAARRERASALLRQVELSEKRHQHTPGRLSGGQQQRVAIARAIANDPRVILADEPTGNVDSITGRQIIHLLKHLSEQGKTVIVVTHDRSIAEVADVRLQMQDGKITHMENYVPPVRNKLPLHKKKGHKR